LNKVYNEGDNVRIHKIKVVGEISPYGGRSLDIMTNHGSFGTPTRTLTHRENQYRSDISFRPSFVATTSEVVLNFNRRTWKDFTTKNGSCKSRSRALSFYADKLDFTTSSAFFQIPQSIDSYENRMDKIILEIQMAKDNLDIISLPPYWKNADKRYRRFVESFCEECLTNGKEPRMYLDMGLDEGEFRKQLDIILELLEVGSLNTIGIQYRPIENFTHNYKMLWDAREHEMWIHCSATNREISRDAPQATMHYLLQRWGIDTFSVRLYGRIPPRHLGEQIEDEKRMTEVEKIKIERQLKEEQIGKLKRFYSQNLSYLNLTQWVKHIGDTTNCKCPICKDAAISEFKEKYSYDDNEELSPSNLSAATRIHEFFSSAAEFDLSRRYIKDGELAEYLKERGLPESRVNGNQSLENLMRTVPLDVM